MPSPLSPNRNLIPESLFIDQAGGDAYENPTHTGLRVWGHSTALLQLVVMLIEELKASNPVFTKGLEEAPRGSA